MNIAFFGTPQISKECLEYLNNKEDINIKLVVTKPDTKKGRKMVLSACEAKQYAQESNLLVESPQKLDSNFVEMLKTLDLDFIVVVAYGKILKQEILDIPKYGPINLHVSDLPKLRGAAPIQWAILNGDSKTAVTTMIMDKSMDTGDILLKKQIDIPLDMTTRELFDVCSLYGKELLYETLKNFSNITPKKQEGIPTIAPMIEKEMAIIDWSKTRFEIHNKVRGLNPFLGAITTLDGSKLKIWKTNIKLEKQIEDVLEKNNEVGMIKILSKKIYVNTGDGYIEILELQGQNGKKMTAKEFLNGHKLDNCILK